MQRYALVVVCVCMRVCVRACVRACVRVCVCILFIDTAASDCHQLECIVSVTFLICVVWYEGVHLQPLQHVSLHCPSLSYIIPLILPLRLQTTFLTQCVVGSLLAVRTS